MLSLMFHCLFLGPSPSHTGADEVDTHVSGARRAQVHEKDYRTQGRIL